MHLPCDTPISVRATGAGASRPVAGRRVGIGGIVAGSLAAGLAAAVLLIIAPLVPATDTAVTGAVLCGFGLGWAMVAVLSMRFTDQPQRWAAAPALLMALSGVLLLGAPAVDPVLDWVWPPAALAVAIGMAVGAHRQLRGRSRRWLLYPVITMLALASIGGGYDTVQEAVDARSNTMPGQLIDVGGHRLHLNCTGSGAPTVVLEPGAGGMSSSLGWITPGVARDTRVCVYDRAGRGWSEPADTPQDAAQIATDLHELLQRGHVPGPYVLAGHSFGGLYVLTFAARYPTEVAGLVLVDSTAPASQPEAIPPSEGPGDVSDRLSALVSASTRIGLGRVLGWLAADGLPPQYDDQVRTRIRQRRLHPQHHRRIPPGRRLEEASRVPHELRRQAAHRADRRQRTRRHLVSGAGPAGHPVHQQRPPHHRRCHPCIPGRRRETSHRHHPSHPGRSLGGPAPRAAAQVNRTEQQAVGIA